MESGLQQENAIYSNIAIQYNGVLGPLHYDIPSLFTFLWKYRN